MTYFYSRPAQSLVPAINVDFGAGLKNVTQGYLTNYPRLLAGTQAPRIFVKLNANLDLAMKFAINGNKSKAAELRRCKTFGTLRESSTYGPGWNFACRNKPCYFCSQNTRKYREEQFLNLAKAFAVDLGVKTLRMSHLVFHPNLHLEMGLSAKTAQIEARVIRLFRDKLAELVEPKARKRAMQSVEGAATPNKRKVAREKVPGPIQSALHMWMQEDVYRAYRKSGEGSPGNYVPSLHLHVNFITYRKETLAWKLAKQALQEVAEYSGLSTKNMSLSWNPKTQADQTDGSLPDGDKGDGRFDPEKLGVDGYNKGIILPSISYLSANYKMKYRDGELTENSSPTYRLWTDYWRDTLLEGARYYRVSPRPERLTHSGGAKFNKILPSDNTFIVRDGEMFAVLQRDQFVDDSRLKESLRTFLPSR